MKHITLWRFYDAPTELQCLSDHGGDEDYLAFVPDGVDVPWWMTDGLFPGFGSSVCECHNVFYDGVRGAVYIGAHA